MTVFLRSSETGPQKCGHDEHRRDDGACFARVVIDTLLDFVDGVGRHIDSHARLAQLGGKTREPLQRSRTPRFGAKTYTILTTSANELMQPINDRMPVILAPTDFAVWLVPRTPAAELHTLLRPYPAEEMTAVPVGRYVNNPRNEGPECLTS